MLADFPELRDIPSPSSSGSSSPALDSNTLALLDDFFSAKAEEEQRFSDLVCATHDLDVDDDEHDRKPSAPARMMSVDEYRIAFGEDWQLSQFWYSARFARRLARAIHSLVDPETIIAFMCCPTAYVGFQHEYLHPGARLLEVDPRFDLLARSQFVRYDLYAPEKLPEDLRGTVGFAVVDPPFLNEDTNAKVIEALKLLLAPNAKLLILTGTSTEPILERLYNAPPLGPLVRTALEVKHEGGRLSNDFGCWGSWPESKDLGRDVSDDDDDP
ncbi:putative N6-adenine methyltransferase-domain-containing protein [Schizophyllum amplum]|uniref:Putative N6-adenine methyltransferase-domain-containing protein n=1 Tax=Schizophyllum amplum TaxID=97359 RepID=A0A550CC94_9AGAR|nr:putative N6-adenine methyltransferase-domain-containing protein [Auriculariopsis ampla]